jgi:hypothetical protein
MFTLADKGLPTFNIRGVILILLGVAADAVTCNWEEKKFFHIYKCSQAEVVFFSSLLGLAISVCTIFGEFVLLYRPRSLAPSLPRSLHPPRSVSEPVV